MELKFIPESDFNQIESVRQIIIHDHPHKFAEFNLGENLGSYGISWRSELIEPIIKISNSQNLIWIGIDEQLAAISLPKGNIRLALTLNSYIFQILMINNVTAVVTEDEVLLFNPTLSIRCIKGLPDIPSEISVKGNDLVIQLMEEGNLILNTQTGTLKELAMITY